MSVISEIKSLIETKKFEDYGIQSLQLGLWENIEGTYYFESNLLNSKGNEVRYLNERAELIEPCLKIIHAFARIKNAVNFISVERENKIFDLTTLDLQQLQNFLLTPELQASVEKAMLQEAVNHSTTHKTASVLKL